VRAIVLLSLFTTSLLASAGCSSHRHCVRYRKAKVYRSWCQSYNTDHSCKAYKRGLVTRKFCTQWACDKGYFKVRGKCISRDSPEGKRLQRNSPEYDRKLRLKKANRQALVRKNKAKAEKEKRRRVPLKRACSAGNREACFQLARSYSKRAPFHRRQALLMLWKLCDLGQVKACYEAGIYIWVHFSWKNKPKVRAAFRKACNKGSLKICARLAYMLKRGQGGPKDPSQARMLYQKACRGGVKKACAFARAQ